jgi:hypothetical protein
MDQSRPSKKDRDQGNPGESEDSHRMAWFTAVGQDDSDVAKKKSHLPAPVVPSFRFECNKPGDWRMTRS